MRRAGHGTEIQALIPGNDSRATHYDLMLEYPLRAAKGLRPSLCVAVCRALGGRLQDVLPTAAVLEFPYHNAFLIHDDIEDGSLMRRGKPTLHSDYTACRSPSTSATPCSRSHCNRCSTIRARSGSARRCAFYAGHRAHVARIGGGAGGSSSDWVRRAEWRLQDRHYLLMAFKKTCWYTFVAPVLIRWNCRRSAALFGHAFAAALCHFSRCSVSDSRRSRSTSTPRSKPMEKRSAAIWRRESAR